MRRWLLPDDSTGQNPGTLARKLSRCKEGMPAPTELSGDGGALFAVRVQILLSITRVGPAPLLQIKSGVQVESEPGNYHVTGFLLGALAQCRGTICLEVRNLSRCRIYITVRCACPGVAAITNLS